MSPGVLEAPAGYELVCRSVWAALALAKGARWEGLERVPPSGPLIVAANHVSMLDPLLMGVAVSRVRYPHFMGKEELFRVPLLGAFLRRYGSIPLDRSRGDVRAMRSALEVLEGGGCMVLFPEGTRSRTGQPGKPKAGVALLARQTRAPVLPARVFNTRSMLGPGPFLARFGRALPPPEGGGGRADDRAYAERVMAEILSL